MRQTDEDDDVGVQGPIDLGAEAALELEELRQRKRQDAPALVALFEALRKPLSEEPVGHSSEGISMLADARAYSVLRRAVEPYRPRAPVQSKDFAVMISKYFDDLLHGVKQLDNEVIEEAKHFCLSLTRSLATKQYLEIHNKKEASNNRYLNNVDIQ